ncbi:MAG TPA: hypothetical protein VNL18_00610 [Gemmatimonadales bacterium]|nr:hypothetical protein [Gemmatimonadales bacterium]
MPSPALYLFKAARRPLYRKENLQILAAERASVVDVWYNRGWVAPELFGGGGAVAPGTPVVFVYTDRPWTPFVPVRQGEVLDAPSDDLAPGCGGPARPALHGRRRPPYRTPSARAAGGRAPQASGTPPSERHPHGAHWGGGADRAFTA